MSDDPRVATVRATLGIRCKFWRYGTCRLSGSAEDPTSNAGCWCWAEAIAVVKALDGMTAVSVESEPGASLPEPVIISSVTLPASIHAQVQNCATHLGISVQEWLSAALTEWLKGSIWFKV